ncbi:MAG: FadR/GntR family transcriptional regulator [Janthinobacterium lividum]
MTSNIELNDADQALAQDPVKAPGTAATSAAAPRAVGGGAADRAAPADVASSAFTAVAEEKPGFAKIKRRRIFEEICEQIRRKLARGEYKPGDKLPTERDLAAEFGVGRPAVREALRTLENSGILVLKKGLRGGAYVREGHPEVLKQSLRDLMDLGHITLPSLMEARSVITGSVVKLACERGTVAEFDAIEDSIRLVDQLNDKDEYYDKVRVSTDFFRLIAAATHNEVLALLVDSLTVIVRYVVINARPAANERCDGLRWQMLENMRARNVEGAQQALEAFFDIVQSETAYAQAIKA